MKPPPDWIRRGAEVDVVLPSGSVRSGLTVAESPQLDLDIGWVVKVSAPDLGYIPVDRVRLSANAPSDYRRVCAEVARAYEDSGDMVLAMRIVRDDAQRGEILADVPLAELPRLVDRAAVAVAHAVLRAGGP